MLSFFNKGIVSLLVVATLGLVFERLACAQESSFPTLTNIAQIRDLPQTEARKGYPVEINATVTCYDPYQGCAFLQVGTNAIYARYSAGETRLKPGDAVIAKGFSLGGDHNYLAATTISVVSYHSDLPLAVVVGSDHFSDIRYDCLRTMTTGTVERVMIDGSRWIALARQNGREFNIYVVKPPRVALNPADWIGARVEFTGPLSVQAARPARIFCPTTESIRLIERSPRAERTRIAEISKWASTDRWLAVTGRVSAIDARTLKLKDDSGEIAIDLIPFARVGDEIEATGFAMAFGDGFTLSPVEGHVIERDANGERRRMITSIAELRALSRTAAEEHLPARAHGVVTYYEPGSKQLFIHDGASGVFVWLENAEAGLTVGTQVEVTGRSGGGMFAPIIDDARLSRGQRGEMPAPKTVTITDLLSGREDSALVEISGVVRHVRPSGSATEIHLAVPGGKLIAHVACPVEAARALEHATVKISGVASGLFNERGQITAALVYVPGLNSIFVDELAPADLFSATPVRLHDVFGYRTDGDSTKRVVVAGVVAWQEPDGGLYLMDGEDGLFVDAPQSNEITVGSRVEAVGYPTHEIRFEPILGDSVVRKISDGEPPKPVVAGAAALRGGDLDATLVKVRARLISGHQQPGLSKTTWQTEDGLFIEAMLETTAPLALEPSTIADLTGVARTLMNDERKVAGFELHLRSPADLVVVATPGWWTADRMWRVVSVLGLVLAASFACVVVLRRKVAEKTKLLKEQLSKEETLQQQYRSLFENNPHPMWVFDPQTLRFLAVNETAVQRYGYSREEFLSMTSLEIRPPAERERLVQLLQSSPTIKQDGSIWVHQRKDGSRLFAEITAREISFSGKRALLVLAHDVTERIAMEKALRSSEAKFRRVVESSLIGVVFFKGDGTITDSNDSFLAMVGRTHDDVRKGILKASDFAPSDRIERHQNAMKFLVAHGTAPATRREVLRADGSRAPAMVGAVALDNGDAYVAFVLDLTKEAALEQQVILAQKMEAVGLLAGGVAHDFNNLLQVIQGYTLVSLETLDANANELRENLDQVKSAAERAAELTQQLLFFSRQQNIKESIVDVAQTVEETLKLVGRVIGEHIEVKFLSTPNLPKIRGDKGRIEQVLMNLCVNARDAMPKGGRLTIDLSTATLTEGEGAPIGQVGGQYVCLRVTDTGCGMDAATIARIYEPFFTTKSKEKGSGLGLSIVYGIVERHKGVIRVHSKVGAGTTFTVYFPATAVTETKTTSFQPQSADTKGMETILLVEDEPAVRTLAARVLKRAGYDVREAANGLEACDVFKEHASEIDLVLMDVIMPKMGGRDAYENIVKTRNDVPVIFCSGYSERELGADFLQQHDLDLLPKPYRPEELLTRVRERLHSHDS